MAPSSRVMHRLPFSASTTPLQAAAYLLGICLFSISFLVFLNSSVSFVVTDLIGQRHGVGDVVGTLGFADELVALVACPVWGLASDRVGVRAVAVTGYAVIGLSLFLFVQARNIYPQLLLARILFAVGATAASTMVTAILPSLTGEPEEDEDSAGRDEDDGEAADNAAAGGDGHRASGLPRKPSHNLRASITPSVDSQLTITPERFRSLSNGSVDIRDPDGPDGSQHDKSSALAGWVGLFTGCGALVALALFLPLPAHFARREGVTLGQAVSYSFYVVGTIALAAAVFVAFGLRSIRGEEGKGWRALLGLKPGSSASEDGHGPTTHAMAAGPASKEAFLPYWRLLKDSVLLGFRDPNIGLGYLGGFVARASTVAISLFIPLFVNAFFIRSGFCQGSPTDPSPELREECRAAYVLASILTGVAQLTGLMAAPVFGYLSGARRRAGGGAGGHRGRVNVPVVVATVFGIVGYVAFPQLPSPEFRDAGSRGGSPLVFLFAALVGISQIGAIVCSLGSLGRGVLTAELPRVSHAPFSARPPRFGRGDGETSPLLLPAAGGRPAQAQAVSRVRLKGSIAGVYSWCGGAAILLLTKLGGHLFDVWSTGAPFYLMAAFNAVLLMAALGVDVGRWARERRPGHLDV